MEPTDKENDEPQVVEPAKKEEAKSVTASLIWLLVLLGGIFYVYPRYEGEIGKFFGSISKPEPAELAEGVETPDKKEVELIEVESADEVPDVKYSPELENWVPLVKSELEKHGGDRYQLRYLAMSEDKKKLLLDMVKLTESGEKSYECRLVRDEFGRYVSHLDELPIKLYPPSQN